MKFISDLKDSYDSYRDSQAVALTQQGKQKAESFTVESPRYEILAALLENGTMSIAELAKDTNFSVSKARDICRSLLKSGYIKKVS